MKTRIPFKRLFARRGKSEEEPPGQNMDARGTLRFASVMVTAHLLAVPCLAQPGLSPNGAEPIVYTVTAPDLINHKLRVEAQFPPDSFPGPERTLALPVWTPGSYKVRDYSKSITDVRLLGSGPARLEKTAKNRWTVVGDYPKDQPLRVSYTVYGHELSVRTNFFTPDLSLLVGAATFMAPAPLPSGDSDQRDYEVRMQVGDTVSSGLAPLDNGTLVAHGYDELLDSPIVFGELSVQRFEAGGKPHSLVHGGDLRYWDQATSLKDAAKVVKTVQDFWGVIPYDDYQIMNLVLEARGGLEHLDSTVIMSSRFATSEREKYLEWLAVVAHEFFHAWNVKRLRPKALGPFDYEREVTTPSLWIAEGITSYYDDLLIRRAGLSTRQEYLKALSGQLNNLFNTPGRKSLPLTEASLDAWIRGYQPTDNSVNDDISYYNKGCVVAWLLDTEIRKASNGKMSLDEAMRDAYRTFAASNSGYTEQQFRARLEASTGLELDEFFRHALDSTEELDIGPALEYWGLNWVPEDSKVAAEPYLGLNSSTADARLVESVAAGSPAAQGGLSPGDELLAIDGVRVPSTGPGSIVKYLKIGGRYPVLVSRGGRVQELTVTLTAQPAPKRALKIKEGKGAHPRRIEAWLGDDSKSPETAKESTL